MPDRRPVERVLVVDDDDHARQVVEGHLLAAGYAVVTARSGAEALELFQRRRPDLVVMDVLMPGMDGFQTCQRLRELEGGLDVPILIVTALGDLASHLETSADDVLAKPLNRTELLSRVGALLGVRRLRAEISEGRELIRTQQEELETVRRRKEELVVLAVHDLKQPVNGILSICDGLLAAPSPHEGEIRTVHAFATRIRRVVLDLLEVSRSEAGALVPRMETVDVRGLLADVVARASTEHPEARIETTLVPAAVSADPYLLARVFENLLENGLEYSPPGRPVGVRVGVEGGQVVVRVADEGPHIPPRFRERAFQRFAELERQDAPRRVGHGLGLVFCRRALTLLGGSVTIEDNEPEGTVFCVRLMGEASARASTR